MAHYSSVIDVDAAPEHVFAYLSDPRNRVEWDPAVRTVEGVGDPSADVGDRYEVTVGFYGKAIEATYEITELDAPARIVFTAHGKVNGRDVIEIAPRAGGSSVRLEMDVSLKGMARVLDRGLQLAFAGIGENAAAGMKKRLASSVV